MKKALMVISPGARSPLTTLEASGEARWDDDHRFWLGDVALFRNVDTILRAVPAGHRVEARVTYSTDGFVTGQWAGKTLRYQGEAPGEDWDDWHCGDGCCVPDGPTDEDLRLDNVSLASHIEARDDVTTTVTIELVLVGPDTAQVTLAHPWEGHKPGDQITVDLDVARRLDRGGALLRT